MKLTRFETALRAKYRTPADALRALGIDENILDDNNRSKQMARRIARDQEMTTVEEILTAVEALSEEERLELMNLLQGSVEGEDTRGRRRGARDDPPPFPGRRNTGGSMDPLNERSREAAQDRRRLAGDSLANTQSVYDDWARRYPDAARIKVV